MLRMDTVLRRALPLKCALALLLLPLVPLSLLAQGAAGGGGGGGGEASLVIPDLSKVQFLGVSGHSLLMFGLLVCGLGFLFGLMNYSQLKGLPVHESMREMSELIYETCKT